MQVYSQRTSKNQVWYLFISLQVLSTQLIILYYPVILSHQHSTTVSLPSLFFFPKRQVYGILCTHKSKKYGLFAIRKIRDNFLLHEIRTANINVKRRTCLSINQSSFIAQCVHARLILSDNHKELMPVRNKDIFISNNVIRLFYLECAFIRVAAVWRFALPLSRMLYTSSLSWTTSSSSPWMTTDPWRDKGMSMIMNHILHTVLYTFPKVLTRRICLIIKNF